MSRAKAEQAVDYTVGDSAWEAAELQGRGFGRPPKYETAEQLWETIMGYFKWVKSNPLKVAEVKSFKDDSWDHMKPVQRPMTIVGMCTFLGIDDSTWRGWRDPKGRGYRADFSAIIERAERIIRDQKLEGALAGLYNPTIVSRVLGLSEQVDVKGTVNINIGAGDDEL